MCCNLQSFSPCVVVPLDPDILSTPFKILNLFRTLSSWGSSNYRPSAPFLYGVASHVKKLPFRPLLLLYVVSADSNHLLGHRHPCCWGLVALAYLYFACRFARPALPRWPMRVGRRYRNLSTKGLHLSFYLTESKGV